MHVFPSLILSLLLAGHVAKPIIAKHPLPLPKLRVVAVSQMKQNEEYKKKKAEEEEEQQPVAKSILIFLGVQRAFILENGLVKKTYQISSGAPGTPTPTGKYQIYRKQELRVSSLSVPYRMAKYMAFTSNEGFGLHALPYLGNVKEHSVYWKEARAHIGIPVSHGCIRFLPEEADEVYDWADVGTPVIIQS